MDTSTTGTGEAQSELLNKVTSRGFIRKQGLVVYSNSGAGGATAAVAEAQDTTATLAPSVTADAGQTAAQTVVQATAAAASTTKTEQVQQAKMQGYEGESCPECQNFTLVRNGTCLKCNTCGSTTGCS